MFEPCVSASEHDQVSEAYGYKPHAVHSEMLSDKDPRSPLNVSKSDICVPEVYRQEKCISVDFRGG